MNGLGVNDLGGEWSGTISLGVKGPGVNDYGIKINSMVLGVLVLL